MIDLAVVLILNICNTLNPIYKGLRLTSRSKTFTIPSDKRNVKIFKKSFADRKKVVSLQPLKTAALAANKFIKIMFIVVV